MKKKIENKIKEEKKIAKGFFKGFKEFITKGNVIDLAVGMIIGAAFGKIVGSLVNDIIMPPIGMLIKNVDFKDLVYVLKEGIPLANGGYEGRVTINYGLFIMTVIEFVIIAFAIYAALTLVIRRSEFKAKLAAEEQAKLDAEKAKEPKEEKPSEDILLLREIRDALNNKKE